jgi:alpha-methylacyl-CoA racemase
MFAAFGIVCGLMEARATGRGQIVDAAMLDGSTLLMSQFFGFLAEGTWAEKRGSNILDGGAPWYRTYETADGRYLAVGAFEARFWENFLVGLGLEPARMADRAERANWEALTDTIAEIIKSRPVAHWSDVFAMLDACVTPVLSMREGMQQPHMRERGIVIDWNGVLQPAPAPRFSETPGALQATREFDSATSVLDVWERDPGPCQS